MQFDQLRRRELITLLGGAAAWPLAARAQQATPVIGFLSSRSPNESAHLVAAFRQGLEESGYLEGQHVHISFRWAEGGYARLPELAAESVRARVAVIASVGGPVSALAATNHSRRLEKKSAQACSLRAMN
jgi:putative tryptophan/tyrosine transport system substrate-binding protein